MSIVSDSLDCVTSAAETEAVTAAATNAGLALNTLFNNHLDFELPRRLKKMIRDSIDAIAPSLSHTTDEKLTELALRVLELEQRKEQDSTTAEISEDFQCTIKDLSSKVDSLMADKVASNQRLDELDKQVITASSRMRSLEEHLNTLAFNVTGVDHQLHEIDHHAHQVEEDNQKLQNELKNMHDEMTAVRAENETLKTSLGRMDSQIHHVDQHMHDVEQETKKELERQESHLQQVEDQAKHELEETKMKMSRAADETGEVASTAKPVVELETNKEDSAASTLKDISSKLFHEERKISKMQQGMTINVRLKELEDKLQNEIDKNREQDILYEERNERHIKKIEDHVETIEVEIQELRDANRKEPTGRTLDVAFHTNHAAKTARLEGEVAQLTLKSARVEEGFSLLMLATEKMAEEQKTVCSRYLDSQSRLETTAGTIEKMYNDLQGAVNHSLDEVQNAIRSCAQQPQFEELKEKFTKFQEMTLRNADTIEKISRSDKNSNGNTNQDDDKVSSKPALTTIPLDPRPTHCISCMRELPLTSREELVEEVPPGVAQNTNTRSFTMVATDRNPRNFKGSAASDSVRYGTMLDPPLHKVLIDAVDAEPHRKPGYMSVSERRLAIDALRASEVPLWPASTPPKYRAPLAGHSSPAFQPSLDNRKVRVPSRGVPVSATAVATTRPRSAQPHRSRLV